MREVVADWNQTTITCRIPPELLAVCFAFLSLNGLLTVTRVCQCWRMTALATPGLWGTLTFDLDRYANENMLGLAVSRAGRVPLDYSFSVVHSAKTDALARALAEFMQRTRRISWTIPGTPEFLLQAAPVLESFSCTLTDPIPSDLFGGTAGRLRTLDVQGLRLPETCPALSTVTTLRARLGPRNRRDEAEALVHLFAVCPLLEHLELSDLAETHLLPLPARAPTRLRTLILRMYSLDTSDIMRYLCVWGPVNPHLSRVRMDMALNLRDAAPIFEDAEVLSVSQHSGCSAHASIETTSARGRECTVVMRHLSYIAYDTVSRALAGAVQANSAQLGRLRALSAPVTVLDALLNPPPALPALSALTVLVEKWAPELPIAVQMTHGEGCGSQFASGSLAFLLNTQDMALANIDIVASTSAGSLEESGVDRLLDTLTMSLPLRPQEHEVVVVVRGFRRELVADVVLPRIEGYSISLEAHEHSGDPSRLRMT
ncbi:hypothetical protein AURDEDRAFT_175802 [Auricularia subglabra TFB-10046 SS5]|uniref:Uncharacterized protein n=1 Tax=Auricularia subglabra (strain TFB-10046 / SS5) TaxID=717982 RepID=J0WSH3_AURST|nr:hypothetical protein AURDEDRAFT_175802 [Auricularia subglabra TFB-10046 SS5]